jgi:hypothetical protein
MEYIALGSIENEDEDANIYLYFAVKKVVISTASSSQLSDAFLILTVSLAILMIFAQVV